MKTVLILKGSPRKNGNSALLADEFARGAADAGHKVETVLLREKEIGDCLGCAACQENGGQCVQNDDMTALCERMLEADVIVFASPVWFYTWFSKRISSEKRSGSFRALCANGFHPESFLFHGADQYSILDSAVHGYPRAPFVQIHPGAHPVDPA